jgi:hypothetical protein
MGGHNCRVSKDIKRIILLFFGFRNRPFPREREKPADTAEDGMSASLRRNRRTGRMLKQKIGCGD